VRIAVRDQLGRADLHITHRNEQAASLTMNTARAAITAASEQSAPVKRGVHQFFFE
jgi:hypothetical protein